MAASASCLIAPPAMATRETALASVFQDAPRREQVTAHSSDKRRYAKSSSGVMSISVTRRNRRSLVMNVSAPWTRHAAICRASGVRS